MSEQDKTNVTDDAFEKWFGETYKDLQFNRTGMIEAWQAAQQQSAGEIAELKSTVKKWQENSVDLEYSCLDKNILITELQVNNNRLREALELAEKALAYDVELVKESLSETPAKDCQYGKDVGMPEYTCVGKCQYAATPAESLQAFENEVLERAAKSIDEMVVIYTNNCDRYKALGDEESTERNVNKGRAAISCAEVIRALKG